MMNISTTYHIADIVAGENVTHVMPEPYSIPADDNFYKTFAESWTDKEDQLIPEDVVNDWIDRLTIRSFNEES